LARRAAGPQFEPPCPFTSRGRGATRQPLAPLTSGDALRPGGFDDTEGFTIRFLKAITREVEDALSLLWTMEREWRGADGGIPMSWQPVNIPAVPSS
jgi:hypothetical protein